MKGSGGRNRRVKGKTHPLLVVPFTLADPLRVARVYYVTAEQDVRKYGLHSRKVISALNPEIASERGTQGWAASWKSKDSENILPTHGTATLTQ